MRAVDEPIPADEKLFRAVGKDDVDGNRVLEAGIEIPQMSCNRAKYSKPADVVRSGQPGIAFVTPGSLPPPVVFNDVEYLFFAIDDPIESNEAHAEVRVGRTSDRPRRDPFKPRSKDVRLKLRALLADRLILLKPPK